MIVAGSLRQLPYSLRVDGRQTYIVGYAFTPTGVEEPTVGNDWYPVDLDVYDNQEYASVDAYIASEDGQATLQGCGVSALVPLATATQRLAENGINITVVDIRPLNDRTYNGGNRRYLVDATGKIAIFTEAEDESYLFRDGDDENYSSGWVSDITPQVNAWGASQVASWQEEQTNSFIVGGVAYTLTNEDGTYALSPAAGTYGQ